MVQTGPLGQGCGGPTSLPFHESYQKEEGGAAESSSSSLSSSTTAASPALASDKIFACGYGRDGGLAIISQPGGSNSHQRLAEANVNGIQAVFNLPSSKVSLLAKSSGGFLLFFNSDSGDGVLQEVDSHATFFKGEIEGCASSDPLGSCRLMEAKESGSFIYVVASFEGKGTLLLSYEIVPPAAGGGGGGGGASSIATANLVSETVVSASADSVKFVSMEPHAYMSSSGVLGFAALLNDGSVKTYYCQGAKAKEVITGASANNRKGRVVAIDVFLQNKDLWTSPQGDDGGAEGADPRSFVKVESVLQADDVEEDAPADMDIVEEEEEEEEEEEVEEEEEEEEEEEVEVPKFSSLKVAELRDECTKRGLDTKGIKKVLIKRLEDAVSAAATSKKKKAPRKKVTKKRQRTTAKKGPQKKNKKVRAKAKKLSSAAKVAPGPSSQPPKSVRAPMRIGVRDICEGDAVLHIGIVTEGGALEVYPFCDEKKSSSSSSVWSCAIENLAYFPDSLELSTSGSPKLCRNETEVMCSEINFFVAGPLRSAVSGLRSFHLMVHNDQDDVMIYEARTVPEDGGGLSFRKCNLDVVLRGSKAAKSLAKVKSERGAFQYARLRRFSDISGHSGLFAAISRPAWVLSERGNLSVLPYKLRFSAPGETLPVKGFVSCPQVNTSAIGSEGFLTVHERIGSSQVLTAVGGLDEVLTGCGFLCGGGIHVKKVPLGSTVKKMCFVNIPNLSSTLNSLYVLLVTTEEVIDMRSMDDDGLTDAERYEQRKEENRVALEKLINADLRGHEYEYQEWVEFIRHSDFLEIDPALGRCPPEVRTRDEIWLVDSGSNWKVLQKVPLGDGVRGTCVELVNLTEEEDQHAKEAREATMNFTPPSTAVVAIGTGIVDNDGEETTGKGKVLFFELVKNHKGEEDGEEGEGDNMKSTGPLKLSLTYEKEIRLGPVTALAGICCDGKRNLIIGAGSEVTIEQWKDRKLQQIGASFVIDLGVMFDHI